MDSTLKLYGFCALTLGTLGLAGQGLRWFRRTPLEAFFGVGLLCLVSDLAGLPGVAIGQACLAILLVLGMAYAAGQRRERKASPWRIQWGDALVFALSFGFWAWSLRDLAALPSVDDGTFHLFLYTRIQETLHSLSGQISFLREATRKLGYYPSGFHALAAVAAKPASWFLSTDPVTELKGMSLLVLGFFPVFLLQGARRIFRSAPELPLVLAAVCASFLEIFPLNPMGEGGISRVAGQVVAIPVIFRILQSPLTMAECFGVGSAVAAILFWIHPSCAVLVGAVFATRLVVGWTRSGEERLQAAKGTVAALFGGVVSGALVWMLLRSGASDLQGAGVLEKWVQVQVQGLQWKAWLDRVKGPIHYFLVDGAGYGKFLSPRSLLAEWGMGILLFRPGLVRTGNLQALRPYLWGLILLPFALSLTIFTSFPPALYLGLFFYHFVKRIAELFFWPLFIGWVVGFVFFWERFSKKLQVVAVAVAVAVVGSIVATSWVKLDRTLEDFNQRFRSPTRAGLSSAFERFEKEDSPGSIWICPTNDFQPWLSVRKWDEARGLRQRVIFEKSTECISALVYRDYCRAEVEAILRRGPGRWVPLLGSERGCRLVGPS